MALTVASPPAAPCLRDLRMTDQLFLWTVRHLVCAAEDGLALNPRIDQFYSDAGVPRVVGLTIELLRTLSQVATRSITVNVPCGVQVLDDESALLADLRANQGKACGLQQLADRVGEHGARSVAGRLHELAREFAALDALRGGAGRASLVRVQ